jgi:oligoribonuclease
MATRKLMKPNPLHLIWIDLEMTGLNPDEDRIIEIATIITDGNLEIIAEGPVFAIAQSEERLLAMDEWNTKQHTRSGLVERVRNSPMKEEDAEAQTLEFIMRFVPPNRSPMCGNSICQDRRFLYRYMPKLEQYFHYRNLDVSTVKELAKHWKPSIVKLFKKKSAHLAMEDIKESIGELRHYRDTFFLIE